MSDTPIIHGFSKLSRSEKLRWIQRQANLSADTLKALESHLHGDQETEAIYSDLSENNISNFFLPLGLAPNFLINNRLFTIPMVTEESSVVAAASFAAKFWAQHGGFQTKVTGVDKVGQVHFTWSGARTALYNTFNQNKEILIKSAGSLTHKMEKRGGGVESLEIKSTNNQLPQNFQLFVTFRTAEAMGANFINSVLERIAGKLSALVADSGAEGELEIIMAILSNYTPECIVQCFVEGENEIFKEMNPGMSGKKFAEKFRKAVDIATYDTYRAVTHNKGIFNGMDAVVLATGNDFRAMESCGHAFASRKGTYGSLSKVDLSEGMFHFSLEVPLAVGTVGGVTGTHPMAKASLEILENPSAEVLMQVIASAGLANNFSAVRSLITTGIQQGHMKMHLGNILRQFQATADEAGSVHSHFRDRTISHAEVGSFLQLLRKKNRDA